MTPGEWVAVLGLVLALLGAIARLLAHELAPVRHKLDVCERERIELRRRLELVTAAIIGTLPREQRIDLLAALDDRVPPFPDDSPQYRLPRWSVDE